MKYSLSLNAKCEDESEKKQLLKLFIPEDKELSNGRARYDVKEQHLNLIFEVQAKDAVALRAIITSISKTLDIYEQTKKLSEEKK